MAALRSLPLRPRRRSLFFGYVVAMTCIAVTLFAAFTAWSYNRQQRQVEEQLVAEARVLQNSVRATWDFMDNAQDLINYDSQGNYEFKGLYCSLVGKSVGKLFTLSTDHQYELRYVRFDPRNVLDAPDEFETRALEAFYDGAQTEYYDVVEGDGDQRTFRYVAALPLSQSCLECHGGPVGELDVTGFPKEGLEVGDIGGAVSISMPMALYQRGLNEEVLRNVAFFVLFLTVLLGAGLVLLRRYVVAPLRSIEHAFDDVAKGRMGDVDLAHVGTSYEMDQLACGVERMSHELGELYATLENRVAQRTRLYREANDALVRQRAKIAEANEKLARANARLSEENEYRTSIISIISHELKTPLTAILSFADLWESSSDDHSEEDRECVAKIKSHGRALLEMVNNVLDIARLESGHVELERVVVDPVDLAAASVDMHAFLAQAGEVDLAFAVDPDVPLFLGDWDQLGKILNNLVGNAVKFTPPGGTVDLIVSAELHAGVRFVVFEVRDTGIGIEPDRIEGIFDRFVQADASISRRYRGSGLGLSLVKKTAEAMGGRVEVRSEVGVGSTFAVKLPVEVVNLDGEGEGE